VVGDYVASSERVARVVARLQASSTYAENLRGRPLSSHLSRPEAMITFLNHIDRRYGGVAALLSRMGWTDTDAAQLRAKLRD
jgi:protein-tyrosine phosphatase